MRVWQAKNFSDAVQYGIQVFVDFYSPRSALSACQGWHPTEGFTIPIEVQKLKDVCAFDLDHPLATWGSLQKMASVAENELLCVRRTRSLACEFKMLFHEEYVGSQLAVARDHSSRYFQHLTALLTSVKSEKDESLDRRTRATDALRTAVELREQSKQQLLALETRLTEAKRRNASLLLQLQRCRDSYEKAIAMGTVLQNFKMDPVFKSWFAVGEFHTASIADWYALRADCAGDIERLECEIQAASRQVDLFNNAVEQQRLKWMAASISDVQACERSEQLEDLAHRAVEQVVETEEARVYHLLSCFDLRQKWLSFDSLRRLHTESRAGTSAGAVNQTLVQLSIARLDAIKQEKRCNALKRKLCVYERIRAPEVEKQQVRRSNSSCEQAISHTLVTCLCRSCSRRSRSTEHSVIDSRDESLLSPNKRIERMGSGNARLRTLQQRQRHQFL